jgi:hypothetical protein
MAVNATATGFSTAVIFKELVVWTLVGLNGREDGKRFGTITDCIIDTNDANPAA